MQGVCRTVCSSCERIRDDSYDLTISPPPSALITTLPLFPPASPTAAHRDFLDTPWSPALPSHLFPVDTNSGWQVQQLCAMVAFQSVAQQDAPLHRLLPADQGE